MAKFDQAEIDSILSEYKQYMVKTYGNRTVNDWINVENRNDYWLMPITDETRKMRAMRLTTNTFDIIRFAFDYEQEKTPTFVQETKEGGNAHAMSLIDWEAFIRKDSKLSAVTDRLGKPDIIQEFKGIPEYTWFRSLDNGAKRPTYLHLLIAPYKEEQIVIGIYSESTRQATMMPWAQKVLDASQKGG